MWLNSTQCIEPWVNSKNRVECLCRDNNIRAIYPKLNLSKPRKGHKKFPYLLGKKRDKF